MIRYEIVIPSDESETYVIIKCKNRQHAIALLRLLKKATVEIDSIDDDLQSQTESVGTIAIHGFGKLGNNDSAWIRLGDNWPDKRRIDFTNPETGFEFIDSVKL